MTKGADISGDERYRYTLCRKVELDNPEKDKGTVVFVMLNPSTADAKKDDPTIGRCRSLAKAWGYGCLLVVNLFALRSTDPKRLLDDANPIGSENDNAIQKAVRNAKLVVCAWGQGKGISQTDLGRARAKKVLGMIDKPHHLGLSKKDDQHYPRHPNSPLVPKGTRPTPWNPPV